MSAGWHVGEDKVCAIIFDWGKTIQSFNLDSLFNWLEGKFRIPRHHFWNIFSRRPGGLIYEYECGMSTREFLDRFWKEALAVTMREYEGRVFIPPVLNDHEFLEAWHGVWDQALPNGRLFKFFCGLKNGGYCLYVLSNTNEAHVASIRDTEFYGRYWPCSYFEIVARLDRFIASCDPDIRCRKTHPAYGSEQECQEIFRRALNITGTRPQETVFIDDIEPHVATFRGMGGHGIHFTGSWTKVEAELWEMGVRWK